MLDNIVNLVKDQVLSSITGGNVEIPADKKDAIVDTTTESLMDGLKSNFTLDNLSSLTSMFSGDNSATSNNITSGLQSNVVSALSEKVGLGKDLSSTIASTVIPAVISMFQQKTNDPNDSTFSIESLMKMFGGNNSSGILGALGSLFGKFGK